VRECRRTSCARTCKRDLSRCEASLRRAACRPTAQLSTSWRTSRNSALIPVEYHPAPGVAIHDQAGVRTHTITDAQVTLKARHIETESSRIALPKSLQARRRNERVRRQFLMQPGQIRAISTCRPCLRRSNQPWQGRPLRCLDVQGALPSMPAYTDAAALSRVPSSAEAR